MLPLLFAAQAASDTSSADLTADHAVRRGAVVGLTLGGGIGQGEGYPNNSDDIGKIGYARSRWMPGSGVTLLVMGALSDYLSFGFWYAHLQFDSSGWRARQNGVGLRLEGFPLLSILPSVKGVGLFAEFGVGTAMMTVPGALEVSGTQSVIGCGAFYEWSPFHFLGGHLGLGPSVEMNAVFSQAYDQTGLVVGLRTVFYGGP